MWHPIPPPTHRLSFPLPPPNQSRHLPWETGRKSGKTNDLTKEVSH